MDPELVACSARRSPRAAGAALTSPVGPGSRPPLSAPLTADTSPVVVAALFLCKVGAKRKRKPAEAGLAHARPERMRPTGGCCGLAGQCARQSPRSQRARPAVGPRLLRRAALLSARNTCPRAREPGSRLPAERHSVPGPWTGLDHWKCLDLAWVTGTE